MTEQPVLDQLNTRLLETREVIRSFVKRAAVVEAAPASLLLRTDAEARFLRQGPFQTAG